MVSLKEGMFNNANVIFRTKFVDGVSTVTRTVPAGRQVAAKTSRPTLDETSQGKILQGACSDIFEVVLCTSAPLLHKPSQCNQINMHSMAYDAILVSIPVFAV